MNICESTPKCFGEWEGIFFSECGHSFFALALGHIHESFCLSSFRMYKGPRTKHLSAGNYIPWNKIKKNKIIK